MPKNTYHCVCDRTFTKSSTAETTGYRLTDYGPGHECFGCPFVLELTDGWGEARKIVGHECRAQKLDPKSPEESISYQTGAWFNFANYNRTLIYTLDFPWLMEFIRFYRGLEGAGNLPEEEKTPEELEQYYRGAGLSLGRRVYSFGFTKNKKGLAAKEALFQKFFDESGIAKNTLGPARDKQTIIGRITVHKAMAKARAKEEASVAITYPIPSETTCPLYGGARAKKGGGHVIQCGEWESPLSSDGDFLVRIKRCEGPEKENCRFYLIDWMRKHGHEEEIVGLSDEAIRNIYDGYRLKEAQRAEITPAAPAEVAVPPAQEKVEIQEPPASGRTIADITAEIRFYKAQTVQSVIEIGKRLTEAKAMLEHGQWLDWLENEVEFSRFTANRYMQLSENFSNVAPVQHLTYTKLIALLAVPEEEREEFLEVTHNVGGEEKTVAEMSKRELERVIRERDQALKEQDRLRVLAEGSDKLAQKRMEKLYEAQKELDMTKAQAETEKRRLQQEITRLESRPVEVAIQPPSDEELERIREEAREEGRQEMWEQQGAGRAPGNSWLEGVLVDKSEEYFQSTVKECVFVLIKASSQMPGKNAKRTLENGIEFLNKQIGELFRQCDLLLLHEQGDQEEELDF